MRRVVEWVDPHAAAAVQSVWVDVGIARQDSPGICTIQLDVLLVLKNGILLHLECKTATAEQQNSTFTAPAAELAAGRLAAGEDGGVRSPVHGLRR